MRVKNIKISGQFEVPVNKPDGNGVTYTEDAIAKAYSDINNKPIIIYDKDYNIIPIGVITEGSYNNGLVNFDGYIYAGGTDDSKVEWTIGNIIDKFEINAIGFDK